METIETSSKVVLQGVPRVHFYAGGPRCPEDICSASVIRAVMEYLGENIGCDHCQSKGRSWGLRCSYAYFMGVMGSAWQVAWVPGWNEASFTPEYLPGSKEDPYRRALEAVGYAVEFVNPEAGEDVFRAKIVENIRDKGRPVIAFGIVGPPEPVIITGYDEDGDLLLGWSFFQDFPPFNEGLEYEINTTGQPGYFRKRDWFKDAGGLVLIGEHGEMPDQEKIFEQSLRIGLDIMRTTQVKGAPAGTAGYDAWAEHLMHDEDFVGKTETELRHLHDAHNMGVGQIAEYRWYGSVWLVNTYAKAHYNLAEDLLKAAGCFAAEHALMWQLWNLAGGNGNPDAWQKFTDPEVRRQMIPIILESRDKYAEGAAYIAQALKKLD
ncbi:MAG: hypothetical protein IH586_16995 [Anaerolineaceae bacterium]|nr:hypothetical protein [Anaerolineaceae bacterium]